MPMFIIVKTLADGSAPQVPAASRERTWCDLPTIDAGGYRGTTAGFTIAGNGNKPVEFASRADVQAIIDHPSNHRQMSPVNWGPVEIREVP